MRRQIIRNSSQIQSYGWDPETEVLEIKYLQTGKVFQYEKVPEIIVTLTFEDDVAPGQEWMNTFRAQYKEREVKEQH